MAELHVLKYLCGVRGGRRHQEAIVRKAGSRAVAHDETILAQHHAITCPADCERRPVIDVEPVEEESGIRSLHIDLAERRLITEANGGADVPHLAVHRLQPISFARAGKILSAQPEAGLDKDRILFLGPGMRRRPSRWPEVRSAMGTGQGTDRNRSVGGTEGRSAGLRDRPTRDGRYDCKAVDVGRLALVSRHSEGGIALQVLHRPKAFTLGECDIISRHVVLKIDEGLSFRLSDVPQWRHSRGLILGLWYVDRLGSEPRCLRRLRSHTQALGKAGGERQRAVCGARDHQALRKGARHKRRDGVVPYRSAAVMTAQMHGWIPATGHSERVDLEIFSPGGCAHGNRAQGIPAFRCNHPAAGQDAYRTGGVCRELRRDRGSAVYDRRYFDPDLCKVKRGLPAVVGVGEDGDAAAWYDREPVDVAADR